MRGTAVLKVFKYFKKTEWMLLGLVLGFVVLQVYCDMKLPEYIEKITIVMTGTLEMQQVWMNGMYMLLCALGSACSLLVIGFCGAIIGSRLSRNLREALFDKVMEFSLADVNKFSMATLITRSTNDVTQVQMLFAMGVQFTFRAPILAVWSILKLVGKSWQWSAITGGAVAILLCFSAFVMLFAYPRFKRIQILTDNINRIMREQLTGVRVVRAFNAEKYSQDRFGLANDELTRNNLSVNRTMITMNPIMNVIMAGMSILVFFVGAYIIQAQPDAANKVATFGQIMSVTQYMTQVVMAFLLLIMVFIMAPRAMIAAKRVTDVLIVEPAIKDPDTPCAIPDITGEVEFCDVSFRYPDAQETVLEHISFKAEKGQTVAFIGSTGSGKSTLINLVPRFYDVTAGSVKIDGVDVREYKQADLRKKIGYVPQRGVLFSGDVEENVNFGSRADEHDISDVEHALKISQSADFVAEMDGGVKAHIAQGGTNVSGGQRQRLSIARAICRKPEIFIFDDSFSALDFKTDKVLRDALASETAEATKLIVAQRIGTIMDADKIVVLNDGKQVGEGTHEELMKDCRVYREIALSQLSKEELA